VRGCSKTWQLSVLWARHARIDTFRDNSLWLHVMPMAPLHRTLFRISRYLCWHMLLDWSFRTIIYSVLLVRSKALWACTS
jgi:hypothetical protein